MSLFHNLFSKKPKSSSVGIEVLPAQETGYFGDAEQISNVVFSGLESKNYSGMKQQLANMAAPEQGRVEYVFDYPGTAGTFCAMILCVITTLIYFYFLFIGALTTFFSTALFSVGAIISGVSLAILLVNIYLIARFFSAVKHKMRFDIYVDFLGFKSLEFVEDLALCSKQKETLVMKDLNWAVKQKLIPQGHFSRDNRVFMVSDKVYNKYMEKSAVYDRYFQEQIEKRHRVNSRAKRVNQIMEEGEQYIKKLNAFKTLIKDKNVSRKIERLKNIVSMIFHEMDVNPSQVNSLEVFLNYLLPTTEKLLDTYVSITEKKITVPNVATAKKEINESLHTVIRSFESILEKLYKEYEVNIVGNISAMELAMQKEELSN